MAELCPLSRHAREEILRRQIPPERLNSLLDSPEQRVPEAPGKQVWQSRFSAENGKMYLLRAVISMDKVPPVVITVYRTSKVEKYWRTDEDQL